MSGDSLDRLVSMANQIARNLMYEADPAAAVADHIDAFWTPRMKAQILAHGEAGLDPVARAALTALTAGKDSKNQTRATDPAARGSDAG